MAAILLSKKELLERFVRSLSESGVSATVLSSRPPFEISCSGAWEGRLRVYIWNCTHGGRASLADEYRIQITGVIPKKASRGLTLILGWYHPLSVFVAFDIRFHDAQASSSPSAQVREPTMVLASDRGIAFRRATNGEIAVAFRPDMASVYLNGYNELHENAKAEAYLDSLDKEIANFALAKIEAVSKPRDLITSLTVRAYRDASFRRRVLAAYEHRCSICDLQLEIVEAAHIVPVAIPGSTDETKNGLCLCANHHKGLDSGLIAISDDYGIILRQERVAALKAIGRAQGLRGFRQELRDRLAVPADLKDRPTKSILTKAAVARGW